MVTETLQINIVEAGSRVVVRSIDDIGKAADRATRSLFLIQRSLYVLGAGGILRGLINLVDTMTNYENRLRLTSTSTANMLGVQERLFDVANRSRTEFATVAEIYSRTALSARALGLSQQQVLDVTESLNKAAILSGANSREANASLVQFSQALASNRLGGDELRSILEQLPYVADVIANYLTSTGKYGTVTRGELKKMGKEGKLTADILVQAFTSSKAAIDAAFANTKPTIEQSLVVLKNNLLEYIANLNTTYDISGKVAAVILALANNFDILAKSAYAAVLATSFFYAANKVNQLVSLIQYIRAYSAAVLLNAQYDLGAVLAKEALADANVLQAKTTLANQAATVRYFETQVAELKLMQTQTEYTVVNGRARSVLTGKFVAQAAAEENLTRITLALTEAEGRLALEQGWLATATNATAAAQARAALVGAEATAAQGAATAASSGFWARMAARFPVVTRLLEVFRARWASFVGLIAKNPFVAAIIALSALTIGITAFGDKIYPIAGSMVTLKDIVAVVFTDIANFIAPVTDLIGSAFQKGFEIAMGAVDLFNQAFIVGIETIFLGFLVIAENTWGIFIGTVSGVKAAFLEIWNSFPAAFELIFVSAVNLAIAAIQFLINTTSLPLQGLLGAIDYVSGKNLAGTFFQNTQIPTLKASAAAQQAGKDVAGAFAKGFNDGRGQVDAAVTGVANGISDIGTSIMTDATKRAQDRAATNALIAKAQALNGGTAPTTPPGSPGGGGKGGGGASKDLQTYLDELQKEIDLNKLIGQQAEVQKETDKIEKELKRNLTEAEKALVASKVAEVAVSKEYNSILEELRGPMEAMGNRLMAVNQLFNEGKISVGEYNAELRKLAVVATSGQNNFLGGVSNGLAKVAEQANSFGDNISQWVVGSFDKATDAVVKFAQTGEFSMKEFLGEIFADLLKIMTNQLLSNLVGSLFGIGGSGGLGALNLPKFAGGGDFMVGGGGGTDSQMVMFRASPDERVTIQTPEQQRATKGGGASNSIGAMNMPAPQVHVQIVNQSDPGDTISAMKSDAGVKTIINTIQRNPDVIKRILR